MGRCLSRPPIATDRLSQLDDGRLELQLKRPWRDGTTAFRFTPHELIERLIAQVPRTTAHLTRYHVVLAPAFAARSQIVPNNGAVVPAQRSTVQNTAGTKSPKQPSRFPWASLIWRVFLTEVLECGRCSGRMEIVAALTSKATIARVLGHLGLSSVAPTFHDARPPPQTELPFGDEPKGFDADPPAPEDFAA